MKLMSILNNIRLVESYQHIDIKDKSNHDNFINEFHSKCQVAINKYKEGVRFYRGFPAPEKDIVYYIDPTNYTRKASETHNYINLLFDNNAELGHVGKRSKSVITCTDFGQSDRYGKSYIIFPIGDPYMSYGKSPDFWYNFENTIGHVDVVNSEIKSILTDAHQDTNDSDINILKKSLRKAQEILKYRGEDEEVQYSTEDYFTEDKDIVENFFDRLNPQKNGIESKKLSTMGRMTRKEIWTEVPCYAIDYYKIYQILP